MKNIRPKNMFLNIILVNKSIRDLAGLHAPKTMHGQFRNSPEWQSEPATCSERERETNEISA